MSIFLIKSHDFPKCDNICSNISFKFQSFFLVSENCLIIKFFYNYGKSYSLFQIYLLRTLKEL